MKNLSIIILLLLTFNKAFAAVKCQKVSTGSGNDLVSQTVCWYEYNDTTNYTQYQLIMDDIYRTTLPTYQQAQQNIAKEKNEYETCLSNAHGLYTGCATKRTDALYIEYIACGAISAHLPKLQSIAAGALCTKLYQMDNEKTGAYCSSVVAKAKNNCSFNP
ncbi:hypothetical protein [Colwellia sp. UCD-KL20]|uniref:hypothetical protein n=1 Tax=Colwellia sp. UCD-KL20 TaxID=1917165 RepID=UPI000970844E|nr:hypothetical protein [Colwellia sp. UCD-KL20]